MRYHYLQAAYQACALIVQQNAHQVALPHALGPLNLQGALLVQVHVQRNAQVLAQGMGAPIVVQTAPPYARDPVEKTVPPVVLETVVIRVKVDVLLDAAARVSHPAEKVALRIVIIRVVLLALLYVLVPVKEPVITDAVKDVEEHAHQYVEDVTILATEVAQVTVILPVSARVPILCSS